MNALRMLRDERAELTARLGSGELDHLGIVERSAERRAIRERLADIDADLALAREARRFADYDDGIIADDDR